MTRPAPGLLLTPGIMVPPESPDVETRADPVSNAARRAMRQCDCARCHEGDYTDPVGTSLFESALTRSRDEFVRLVLERNPRRGTTPHGRVAFAVENAKGVYACFREREDGTIPARTFVCE